MTDEILYDVADGIGTITFNRPEARNAFTFAMYERVAEICDAVSADGSARVLVMTGAGDRAFAAGTDIAQFRAFQTPEDALHYEARIDDVITRIERCAVPTLAAVAGACTGGGASIAAACDLRVATRSRPVRLSGRAHAGQLPVRPQLRAARRPVRADGRQGACLHRAPPRRRGGARDGLLQRSGRGSSRLLARTRDLAQTIAAHAPLTLRATKEAIRRITNASAAGIEGDDLVLMCYMSADFREGMEAFLAKRPPHWTGR